MEIFKSIVTNVLTALYQPFWFAVLLTIFILFFYMYAYHPIDTGKGIKSACLAWIRTFKNSLFFRKLFCLVFFTVMILFRTLLNRNMWMNPLSDVMGGWWIWEKQSDGTMTLTTECFENIALMLPFTFLLMWTAKEKLLKAKGRQICFTNILWYSTKVAFLFSLTIEFLQLFLRLGTFQLSDLCYNTLGGAIGGVMYWISKSNYYYRLRCIRKACLEHVQDNSVSCQQVVEIPEKITQQSRSESSSDISIEINGVVIHIKEDISESLLEKIIRVVSRAK